MSVPCGVTEIGDYAFDGCVALESLVLEGDVTRIGRYAFRDTGRLGEIAIPPTVGYMGEGALSHMRSLKRIFLPEKLKEISPVLLRGCVSLTQIKVSSRLQSVGEGSFRDCVRLEKIDLPDKLEHTGEEAFAGCTALSDSEGLIVINGVVFDCISSSRELITVGEGVTRIASRAFIRQSGLREVIFPSTLKVIDPGAFPEGALDRAKLPQSVRTVGEGALMGISTVSLYDTLESSAGKACARYSSFSDTYDYTSHTVNVLSARDGTVINSVPVLRDGSSSYRKALTEAWDGARLDMEVFDGLFPLMISLGCATECALFRMSRPFSLGEKARSMYISFLREHDLYAVETVLGKDDPAALDMMQREGLLLPEHMDEYTLAAEKTASTQMRAALLEYQNRLAPQRTSGFELEGL